VVNLHRTSFDPEKAVLVRTPATFKTNTYTIDISKNHKLSNIFDFKFLTNHVP